MDDLQSEGVIVKDSTILMPRLRVWRDDYEYCEALAKKYGVGVESVVGRAMCDFRLADEQRMSPSLRNDAHEQGGDRQPQEE